MRTHRVDTEWHRTAGCAVAGGYATVCHPHEATWHTGMGALCGAATPVEICGRRLPFVVTDCALLLANARRAVVLSCDIEELLQFEVAKDD